MTSSLYCVNGAVHPIDSGTPYSAYYGTSVLPVYRDDEMCAPLPTPQEIAAERKAEHQAALDKLRKRNERRR